MNRFWQKPTLAERVTDELRVGRELTFNQLVEKLSPRSVSQLALLLADLTASHVIDQIVRVESPETHSGIEEFGAIEEVPSTIYDVYTGRYVDVTPDNVRVLFRHSTRV